MTIKITLPHQAINVYKQSVHAKRHDSKRHYLGHKRRQLSLHNWLQCLDEAIEKSRQTTSRVVRRTSISTGYDANRNVVLRLAVPKQTSLKKPRRNAILIRSLAQQASSEMTNMMDSNNINSNCVSSNYCSSEVPKDKPFSFSAAESNESSALMEHSFNASLTFQLCITAMSPEEKGSLKGFE